VLAGETTPVGPCPDEAFSGSGSKSEADRVVRPESLSRGELSHVHEQAACLPAGKSLAPEKTDTRNRRSPLLRDRRGGHHGRSI